MTTPKFDYPSPTDRFVFVPCQKDDPDRSEFWCPLSREWAGATSGACHHKECGIHWRKRVPVPEGWEIVPSGEEIGSSAKYWTSDRAWVGSIRDSRYRSGENFRIYIRRQPAQPEAPDFWAKTIHGRADFYAISRTYEITDQNVGHALKKLLRCGRTHKTPAQDIAEAIVSLKRWQELEQGK